MVEEKDYREKWIWVQDIEQIQTKLKTSLLLHSSELEDLGCRLSDHKT